MSQTIEQQALKRIDSSNVPFEYYYDTKSAFEKLLEWGWNDTNPSKKLTHRMVQRWANESKAPFKKHPLTNTYRISEADLVKLYRGEL